MNPIISIITPTTGKNGLFKLIHSINEQNIVFKHILLWDNKREDSFNKDYKDPNIFNSSNRYSIVVPESFVQGQACGSSLRAIGLFLAQTEFVAFADDDVWWEKNHIENMLDSIKDANWAYCRRKIWANGNECIGIDNFESVGDSGDRKVPYEMVDNNCMVFRRRFGTSGAVLYRETNQYNDDRLFYGFLKEHAGIPVKVNPPTINQICPKRLEAMFREYCTKI